LRQGDSRHSDVTGGPTTFIVLWTTSRFREQNPRTYNAVLAAFKEATDILNGNQRAAADEMSDWILTRVVSKMIDVSDISVLELADAEGKRLPPFSAGSHVDVRLPGGFVRPYSLCNNPKERHRYVVAVLREANSRGGSSAMHDNVRVGDSVQISEPRNRFHLAPSARRSILLAGGIGVTPILCMAEHLNDSGADFEMHYCTRSWGRTAFIARIHASNFASRVLFHVDDGPIEQRLDLSLILAGPEIGTHVYVCGPSGFIQAALTSARKHGWADDHVHREHFTAASSIAGSDGEFEVLVASTGKTYRVAKDQTVIEVLTDAGVVIPTSCVEGTCGTCLTEILAGEPDHRDSFLTDAEKAGNDRFLPCVSRARSESLVLKL